ncbi:ABC transporter ATP-binding protein [Microbacterium album]|uniref:ABC transporter n=1 Tax=Microbacterium album TaxID=2053191 RepID=A0A917MKI4_9MICO|nr:ABC transporter ATP-binding protein [Microbacterium album]GGH36992.1 ABC transporter [Microbacterium album]
MSQSTTAPGRLERQGARKTLSVEGLGKSYGEGPGAVEVLRQLSLRIEPGEIVSIVGPSGAGKTTLLRCLAGLLPPSEGRVAYGGTEIARPISEVGVVFQDYSRSLLPWMRNAANVAFPLQGRRVPRAERVAVAQESLAAVGLPHVGRKYPWQLSGGQQQRVAIARALAYQSEVLLMDEPFASVDAQTRFDLEDLVLDLRRRLGVSIVVVTHDIDESVYLADRVVVLSGHPATVVDSVEVPFGPERDQIETKADPVFTDLRGRILAQIRR